MKRLKAIPIILLALCAGCKDKKHPERQDDTNLARRVFVAEINPVEVMTLEKRDFHKQIISNGKLEAREKAALAFETAGKLAVVNVSNGSRVQRGDILAVLDTEDSKLRLEQARLAYRKAELDLSDRLLDFDYTPGTDTAAIPRETMRIIYLRSGYIEARHSLETARLAHDRSTLRAPFAGKIADVNQKVHEQTSATFCTLLDDAVLNVKFAVLETEIGFVKMGQPVKVYSFNSPDDVANGRVTAINPTVDINGQIQVTARITNNGRMIDGMNVRVLVENVVPGQLVVPKSAVVIRDNLEVLFRYMDGKAVWTYVHITAANSTEYVVAANAERGADLNPGDIVITSGNLNLGGNTAVRIADRQ